MQKDGRTLNGSVSSTAGGVGRNIADAIGRLQPSNPPFFVSTVGKDDLGRFLLHSLQHVVSKTDGFFERTSQVLVGSIKHPHEICSPGKSTFT